MIAAWVLRDIRSTEVGAMGTFGADFAPAGKNAVFRVGGKSASLLAHSADFSRANPHSRNEIHSSILIP